MSELTVYTAELQAPFTECGPKWDADFKTLYATDGKVIIEKLQDKNTGDWSLIAYEYVPQAGAFNPQHQVPRLGARLGPVILEPGRRMKNVMDLCPAGGLGKGKKKNPQKKWEESLLHGKKHYDRYVETT